MGYQAVNKVRFVTATTLFDGHDTAINIFRRMLQASGVEVVHLGHNRSGLDIVETAIDEDVQAIAVTSYQGGRMEFFRYSATCWSIGVAATSDLWRRRRDDLPGEGGELMDYGITRIYSPDDGRVLGLQGMVDDMIEVGRFPGRKSRGSRGDGLARGSPGLGPADIGRGELARQVRGAVRIYAAQGLRNQCPGDRSHRDGGVGKVLAGRRGGSSIPVPVPDRRVAIISVDPSKRRTGGALLGDRIRMNSIPDDRVYMRSMATRQPNLALSPAVSDAVNIVKVAGFDLILLETSGIGQADTEIVDHADLSVYVMTPEYGAASQLEKIDMLEFADLIAINKADKQGADDALARGEKAIPAQPRRIRRRRRTVAGLPDHRLGFQRPRDQPVL